jgi:hypothetical protein
MQSLRDWGVSELAEAERRVPEVNALIERQRQFIWPPMIIAVGLSLTVAWVGFIGYELAYAILWSVF